MATNTLNDNRSALLGMVRRWDRRQRTQQTIAWLPRAALPGLSVGVVLAVIARFRPLLMPEQIAALTLALVAVGMVIALAVIWLRARSPMGAARHFDVVFGLNERVSTALELLDGRIHTSSELAARQLEDARLTAREVHARERLPLQAGRGDLLALLALGLALVLLLALPNAQSEALAIELAQAAAAAEAVEDAAETVRELTEQVAADPRLDDEQRRDLLLVLEDSARSLDDPDVTPEQAFAAMNDVQTAFQQASDLLAQRLSENAAALQAASEALRDVTPGEGADLANIERMLRQIEAMRQMAEQMGQQPQPNASQSLSSAAEALAGDGSQNMQQAANAMRDAANAMQQGDQSGAQQSLQQAQDALGQAGGENTQQQSAQQSLEQGAQQAQQAGSQINQAQQPPGEQGQQQGQQGQQPPQNQPGSESQNGEGEQSPQQGQSSQGQQGDVPSSQGQDGNAQQGADGENQGQSQQGEGQQSDGAQGDNPGALSGTALRSEGAGAGDNAGGEAQASAGSGLLDANNNPDGLGEGDYTPIYAPERIGGPQGDEQMILEPDTGNAPVVEGDFSSNPTGNARVPYSQVFRSFFNAATRNLDTGYVPLGLRDVVRSYFTSIEPGSGQ